MPQTGVWRGKKTPSEDGKFTLAENVLARFRDLEKMNGLAASLLAVGEASELMLEHACNAFS